MIDGKGVYILQSIIFSFLRNVCPSLVSFDPVDEVFKSISFILICLFVQSLRFPSLLLVLNTTWISFTWDRQTKFKSISLTVLSLPQSNCSLESQNCFWNHIKSIQHLLLLEVNLILNLCITLCSDFTCIHCQSHSLFYKQHFFPDKKMIFSDSSNKHRRSSSFVH